jgi:hypothetical protein
LLLTGCLWGPGKFKSDLALNKNGTFVLDYRGEIMLQMPDKDSAPVPWEDGMITCYADGRVEPQPAAVTSFDDDSGDEEDNAASSDKPRPCTPAEIAREKAKHEKEEADRIAKKQRESDEMAKLFGLPGSDDESNRRFAASLMKHEGWKSVIYKGKGLFEVDYHFEGRLNQDFAFPLMPDSDLMIPFITIRPRTDGSIKVGAPAFVGGAGVFAARAKLVDLPNKGNDGPVSRAEGRFTITTDGEILTNNSEEGPALVQGRRQLYWDVGPGSERIPEMMVRL